MTMQAVDWGIGIRLQSALHIGTGFGLAQILDDRIVQGPDDLPYVPGSSLKGRIRHHVRELLRLLDWNQEDQHAVEARLFGFVDAPGLLVYTDAHLDQQSVNAAAHAAQEGADVSPRAERAYVSLSRQRRVALEQRLFRIEVADAGLQFTGQVRGWLPDATASHDLALLAAAVSQVTHLGGHKGRGLGACRLTVVAASPAVPDPAILRDAPNVQDTP